jgi:hypothetical protein
MAGRHTKYTMLYIRRGLGRIRSSLFDQEGIIVSLPNRSASNNLSLRVAFNGFAPALKKVTETSRVVAAFVYAYTIALGVVYQSNAYPFIIGAQVFRAKISPNRRLCLVRIQAWTFMQQTSKVHRTTFSKRLIKWHCGLQHICLHVHAYIPWAAMTTGRRMTTRRTAERFICEGTIASYRVEVALKKTERADLLW